MESPRYLDFSEEQERRYDEIDAQGQKPPAEIRKQVEAELGPIAVDSDPTSQDPSTAQTPSHARNSNNQQNQHRNQKRPVRKPTTARGKMFADIGRANSEHKPFPYGHKED